MPGMRSHASRSASNSPRCSVTNSRMALPRSLASRLAGVGTAANPWPGTRRSEPPARRRRAGRPARPSHWWRRSGRRPAPCATGRRGCRGCGPRPTGRRPAATAAASASAPRGRAPVFQSTTVQPVGVTEDGVHAAADHHSADRHLEADFDLGRGAAAQTLRSNAALSASTSASSARLVGAAGQLVDVEQRLSRPALLEPGVERSTPPGERGRAGRQRAAQPAGQLVRDRARRATRSDTDRWAGSSTSIASPRASRARSASSRSTERRQSERASASSPNRPSSGSSPRLAFRPADGRDRLAQRAAARRSPPGRARRRPRPRPDADRADRAARSPTGPRPSAG